MLHLTTGLPGAGKTLYTLSVVRERAIKEARPVYYHGIELLKPEVFEGWQKLEDPEKWFECPDGSIIVHDECQTTYRPRGAGARVPQHVAEFETHRHRGFDVYLITQAPTLVDTNVRRLVGEHRHLVRAMAPRTATVHFWAQINENSHKSRRDSERSSFSYPPKILGAYKSATIHTHKNRIPKAALFLFVAPFVLVALIWLFYTWFADLSAGAQEFIEPAVDQVEPIERGGAVVHVSVDPDPDPLQDWIEARTPRVPGLTHTAPVYDAVTDPVTAPVPSACVDMPSKGCRCYTQQATLIDVPASLCQRIVKTGFFVDFALELSRRQ